MGTIKPLLRAFLWTVDRTALIVVAHYASVFVYILRETLF